MSNVLSQHRLIITYTGIIVAGTVAVLVWFNANYVSKNELAGLLEKTKLYDDKLVETHEKLQININQLRLEIKQARTDELWFKKKLLLAKGESNLTEYDITVLNLIDAELQLYNPSLQ